MADLADRIGYATGTAEDMGYEPSEIFPFLSETRQVACLGVAWPPRHGWKWKLVGKTISEADFQRFLALKGNAGKVKPRKSRPVATMELRDLPFV